MAADPTFSSNGKFNVMETRDELTIQFRWFNYMYIFLVFFCIVWNGFLVGWNAIALGSGAWFMSLFSVLHVAVGIGLTYWTICGLFNKTTITVRQNLLKVAHGPIPHMGNHELNSKDLQQLYVKEHISRGKNGTSFTYELRFLDRTNKDRSLISARILETHDAAIFLEQKIEQFLGIEDFPVQGEYRADLKGSHAQITSIAADRLPRRLDEELDLTQINAHHIRRGYLFDYDFKTWEAESELQFDWNAGFSHRQIMARSKDAQSSFLISFEPGHQVVVVEESENPLRWDESILDQIKKDAAPPLSLMRGQQKYYRERAYEGHRFVMEGRHSKPYRVRMWIYENDAKSSFLRIECYDNFDLRGYHGKLIASYKISNVLPGSQG